jgi:hypothetical protein
MITKELLHELFKYKDGNLYWKVFRSPKVNIGTLAGGVHKPTGYYHIQLENKKYKIHRLIFLMHYGYLPKEIDHIDGNPANNKIENLREATRQQNCCNTKLKKLNTSGVKNVHLHKPTNKWLVQLMVNGKKKYFGLYDDLELADLVATEARDKYFGEFAR